MSEWQTIDTAPGDKPFMAYAKHEEDDGWLSYVIVEPDSKAWMYWHLQCGEEYCGIKPTHWMPLPQPPKDAE